MDQVGLGDLDTVAERDFLFRPGSVPNSVDRGDLASLAHEWISGREGYMAENVKPSAAQTNGNRNLRRVRRHYQRPRTAVDQRAPKNRAAHVDFGGFPESQFA